MKKLLLFFLIVHCQFLIVSYSYAQNKTIDSLQKALQTAREDTNKVNTFNTLSRQLYLTGDYDTALYHAGKAKALAENINFQKGIADAYKNIGAIIDEQGNSSEALKKYFLALKIYEAIGDRGGIANTHNNIGLVYETWGNYPEALKNHFIALKIYESIGDKHGIAADYNNIGLIYADQDNYTEALKYYFAALKMNEATGNKNWVASNYNNIGTIYKDQNNYPEALKHFAAALKIYETVGDKGGISAIYNNIGVVYGEQGNYPEALKYYFSALEIREKIGDKNGIVNSYNNIGLAYNRLNRPKEGKAWLQKGLDLGRETGAKENIKKSYYGLSEADNGLSNAKGAYENYKMYILYRDSLVNEDNTRKLTQTEMQYEFDKKQLADSIKNIEAQNRITTKLQKQKTYTWAGVGAGVLLLVLLIFIFRSNKKLAVEKRKSERLLLNILPEEIAEELKQNGHAEAKQFDEVTVLFTDFVSFTQTAEKLGPQQLVQDLHECFTAFDNIIERNGLEKIKTIGDAYLAVCGLPAFDPQHAQKAVHAALEIRDFIAERSRQEQTFQVRIGIHSGSVVAGIVGVKKFAYDIWGDTVNTAARMEQSGEAGKVNISETTYELVKGEFDCTYRGKVEAKNKGEVDMYFVEK